MENIRRPSTDRGSEDLQWKEPLLATKDVAAILGTTERHVRELWATRQLGGVRVGRKVRFRPTDISEYVKRHRVPAR